MQYKIRNETLNSRRGQYQLVELENNPLIWKPEFINNKGTRRAEVIKEVDYAQQGKLAEHKYWQDEPYEWILLYQDFYQKLFNLEWLHDNDDRHSILVSPTSCLTLVQYHDHRLIAYSRSTDMKNGYYSDKLLLEYLAYHISITRPDCEVRSIEWFMAIPHVYKKPGLARLLNLNKYDAKQ